MPKATIMIVEDEWIIADDLRSSLEGMDYRVLSIATSGEDAIAKAEKERPDLVLMDIVLKKKLNGIKAAENIQHRFNIPHIFITAYGDEEILDKAKRTAPYGYLLKPFNDKELNAAIEMALYRHKMESKLKESEERFKGLVETTSDWIWEVDENGVYTYVSPRVRDILGYEPEEILGMKPFDLMPQEEAKRIADIFALIVASQKELRRLENINIHKNGSRVVLETSGVPIFDTKGIYRGHRGIDRDITARKRAEELLKNKNQLLVNVIDSLTHPFYVINVKDYTLELANSSARESGKSGAATCYALSHQRSRPCQEEGYPCVLEEIKRTGRPVIVEHVHHGEAGNSMIVEVHGYPILNEEGKVVQIIEYNLDITDRKKAEQEREQLNAELEQRNKEMEQLIYVTSHDLRTPLAIVQGYTKELEFTIQQIVSETAGKSADPEIKRIFTPYLNDIKDTSKYIRSNIRKMDSLLFGLLKLFRSGNVELNMRHIDMNRLVAEVRESFAYTIKESGANVLVSDLPGCVGDADQLNQVFSNLLGNALKYLDTERSGIITIAGESAGGESVYCVEDNGIGIAPDDKDKIFNVFYQGRGAVAGEGLGLTIVSKILERHNGRIWIESEPDSGSRFYVALPAQ